MSTPKRGDDGGLTGDHGFHHRELVSGAELNRRTFGGRGSLGLLSDEVLLGRGEARFDRLPGSREAFGLLVVDGLLAVQLEVGRAHTSWLVGPDDLIRPWEMAEISLTAGLRWRALQATRLRVVGASFYRRAQRDPDVMQALLARATRTAHWLLAKSLITSAPNIEDRLLLLFTLWGERWGKVTADGIRIKLPLTHELIANCCGCRRPTVTIAIRSLEKKRILTRASRDGWVLTRSPCLAWSDDSCERYSNALGLNPTNDDVADSRERDVAQPKANPTRSYALAGDPLHQGTIAPLTVGTEILR